MAREKNTRSSEVANQPEDHVNQPSEVLPVGGLVVTAATTFVPLLAGAAISVPPWVPCQSVALVPGIEVIQA